MSEKIKSLENKNVTAEDINKYLTHLENILDEIGKIANKSLWYFFFHQKKVDRLQKEFDVKWQALCEGWLFEGDSFIKYM